MNQHPNFRVFLDSAPDRWGRLFMKHREAVTALSQWFDRVLEQGKLQRLHITSAITQLGYYDGKAEEGEGIYHSAYPSFHHPANYLELAAFIQYQGRQVDLDLNQL